MLKTRANRRGLSIEGFDGLFADVPADREQFFGVMSAPFDRIFLRRYCT